VKKKRFRILFVTLLTCLVGFLAWQFLRPHEPTYNGKFLSVWLEQFSANHFRHRGSVADKQAEEAIRQIGTNALPIFLKLITAKDSPLKQKLMAQLPKQWRPRLWSQQPWDRQMLGACTFVMS